MGALIEMPFGKCMNYQGQMASKLFRHRLLTSVSLSGTYCPRLLPSARAVGRKEGSSFFIAATDPFMPVENDQSDQFALHRRENAVHMQ